MSSILRYFFLSFSWQSWKLYNWSTFCEMGIIDRGVSKGQNNRLWTRLYFCGKMEPDSGRFFVNRELLATNQEFNYVFSHWNMWFKDFLPGASFVKKWLPVMFYKIINGWVNGAWLPLIFSLWCEFLPFSCILRQLFMFYSIFFYERPLTPLEA